MSGDGSASAETIAIRAHPPPLPTRFGVAGVHDESIEPRIEPFGITQGRQVAPSSEECLLGRVLGAVMVAEDAVRQGIAAVDVVGGKHPEGIAIAAPRLPDEVDLHPCPSVHGHNGRLVEYGAARRPNVQCCAETSAGTDGGAGG